jgi:hypothetical protein
MKFIAIVLICVLGAILYGIVHDQITIRVCPEYFTVAHPHIINTSSLTVLALTWGVVATWWVGLPLGVLVGVAARVGSPPRLELPTVIRAIVVLLLLMGVLAAAAGGIAWAMHLGETFRKSAPDLASDIDQSHHDRFVAAWVAHSVSYGAGALGGISLAIGLATRRWIQSRRTPAITRPATPSPASS